MDPPLRHNNKRNVIMWAMPFVDALAVAALTALLCDWSAVDAPAARIGASSQELRLVAWVRQHITISHS